MIALNAYTQAGGLFIVALGSCTGWSHPRNEKCAPHRTTISVDSRDVERVGLALAAGDGLRLALNRDPRLLSLIHC